MLPIAQGNFVGCFHITEMLRPYVDGSALLNVRYEGSYMPGFLCVADAKLYGQDGPPESLLQRIKDTSKTLKEALSGADRLDVSIPLPNAVFLHQASDGQVTMLGYFCEDISSNYLNCATQPLSEKELSSIGRFLDQLHARGTGHGCVHPLGIRSFENSLVLSCPVFPISVRDAQMFPTCIFDGNERLTQSDRRAFAMLLLDMLTGNNDAKEFTKRIEAIDTYGAGYPEISAFVHGTEVSCAKLIEQVAETRRQKAEATQRRRTRIRTLRRAVAAILLAIVLFHGVGFAALHASRKAKNKRDWKACVNFAMPISMFPLWRQEAKSLKAAAEHGLRVDAVWASAIRAKDKGNWQQCAVETAQVIALDPNHVAARELGEVAKHEIRVGDELALAQRAADIGQWAQCALQAERLLLIAPKHEEAKRLLGKADRELRIASLLFAAREASAAESWGKCADFAKSALELDSNREEARSLAESARQWILIENALRSAKQAASAGDWKRCISETDRVLAYVPEHVQAKELRASAQNRLAVSTDLNLARVAKSEQRWNACLAAVARVLALEPEHTEARELHRDATRELALSSAREAKGLRSWDVCLAAADRVLSFEPDHAEAKSIKNEAEIELKVAPWLKSARLAIQSREWQTCVDETTQVLKINPIHEEALRLREDAMANLTTLAAAPQRAKKARQAKDWPKCAEAADEILRFDPDHAEALALKAEATRAMADEDARRLEQERERTLSTALATARKAQSVGSWTSCFSETERILALAPEHIEAKRLRAESAYHVGMAYAGLRDYKQAAYFFQISANENYAQAQHELGSLYSGGKGVEQSQTEAFGWHKRAAEQSNAEAQYAVGTSYMRGIGVTRNAEDSVLWLERSAKQGFPYAQFTLGSCYEQGFGVKKNLSTAKSLYKKAADQGLLQATEKLKNLR